jgi:hypothetical protein
MNKGWIALLMLCTSIGSALAQHHDTHRAPNSAGASTTSAPCKEPTLNCARAATPYFAPDGALWVVWASNGVIAVARSGDMGKSFEPSLEIAKHGAFLDTGPDARPQLVGNKVGDMTIAYAFFKDKQWNAQVNTSTSIDQGRSFSTPIALSKDPASQRFASLAVDPQGKLFATWIDKRLVAEAKKAGKKALGGSIAFAWSNDMGKSFSTEIIAQPDSCECCRLGISLTPQGQPVMIYRAIFNGNIRDHATQLVLNETQVAPAERVAQDNWETDSCPHHGPSIAVSARGTYHAAWFTEGSARTGSFYARSTDAGQHYTAPQAIGNPRALPARPYLLANNDSIWMVWKEFDGKRAAIYAQRSVDDGVSWSQPRQVAETVGYSDHPLLIQKQNHVYLSWLTAEQGYRLIPLDATH